MTSNLHNIQNQFLNALQKKSTHLQDLIVSDNRLENTSRLNIYIDSYTIRLYNALAENYSLLFEWVPEESFSKLVSEYINNTPSTNYNLQKYGHKLPEYLKQSSFPKYFHEIAKLDLALNNSYRASKQSYLNINSFNSIAELYGDEFSIKLADNTFVLKFDYSIIQKFIDNSIEINKLLDTTYAAIWSKDNKNMYRIISHDEYNLLTELNQAINFANLWEKLKLIHNSPQYILQQWLLDQILIKVS